MSSKPAPAASERKGTLPSGRLNPQEIKRLNFLGYKSADIQEMAAEHARYLLANKVAKPGSKKAIEKVQEQLRGIPPPAGIDRFSNEAIEERNAERPEPSGIEVTRGEFTGQTAQAYLEEGGNVRMDEYSGKVVAGADPLNAVLIEMSERYAYDDPQRRDKNGKPIRVYPRRFRWEHAASPPRSGPKWDPVYDGEGKQIKNGELFLVWMPEEVYDQGVRKLNLERSQQLTGAIEKTKSDNMSDRDLEQAASLGDGHLSMGRSEADYSG